MVMDDIIVEVFLRLPLKSLTRCKCLSNKWNLFITHDTIFRRNYFIRLTSSSSPSPLLLGFFLTRKPSHPLPPDLFPALQHRQQLQPQVQFLPTCTQGDKLKAADYQTGDAPPLPHPPFDESLSFVDHHHHHHESIRIVSASNGFLLCCLEESDPMTYYVCNPLTKEWVALPKPHFTSEVVPTGFICQGNYPCFHLVNYKVVRGLWPNPRAFSNNLTFEIFSSESFQWKVFNVACPLFFHLQLANPFVVIDKQGAVHWSAITETTFQCAFVTFHPNRQCLQLASLPGQLNYYSEFFSHHSSGLLLYARHDRHDLELWVLHDDHEGEGDGSGKEWSLKYKVNLQMLKEVNPGFFQGCPKYFKIVGFHPLNPFVLYLWKEGTMATYNVEGSSIDLVSHPSSQGWGLHYLFFPYVWPNWPPFFP